MWILLSVVRYYAPSVFMFSQLLLDKTSESYPCDSVNMSGYFYLFVWTLSSASAPSNIDARLNKQFCNTPQHVYWKNHYIDVVVKQNN